jgi:hypothetical protein
VIHGKKIGELAVKLDRKKSRYQHASVVVDLRFDITHGTFWAQYEGNWYDADTKAELTEKIKIAATRVLSIEWRRYLQIDYEADGWPIEDARSGRPASNGQYHTFQIDHDRSRFGHGSSPNEPFAICSVKLHWSVCEISEPYALPEDPKKRVRARRSVDVVEWGDDKGRERIGDPEEWDDDVLPLGTLLWTPEREALLASVLAALGDLDRRLVELFSGDACQLANKIDAAQTDPSKLLAASSEAPAPKKRRRS